MLHLALCTGVTECGDATVVTETSVDAIHHSGLSPHGRQRVWSEAHYTHALSHPTRRLQNQREKIAGCRESSTEISDHNIFYMVGTFDGRSFVSLALQHKQKHAEKTMKNVGRNR